MRTLIIILLLVILGSNTVVGNPWLRGRIDNITYPPPTQTMSLDIGFTIPFSIDGLSLNLYTGLLAIGYGPYQLGKKLGGEFVYRWGSGIATLGMYNCGVDRDHFYFSFFWDL